MRSLALWTISVGVLCWGCSGEPEKPPGSVKGAELFREIEANIFVPHCVRAGCHRGPDPAGGLDLATGKSYANLVNAEARRRPDRVRVVPGRPDRSYLLERLLPGGDTPRMPLLGGPLPEEQVEQIRNWIRLGAKP